MGSLIAILADALKLAFGDGADVGVDVRDVIHVGNTYNVSVGREPEESKWKTGNLIRHAALAGAAAAALVALAGVGGAESSPPPQRRARLMSRGGKWAASLYIRNIDATFTLRGPSPLSAGVSQGAFTGGLDPDGGEVAVPVEPPPAAAGTAMPAENPLGEYHGARGSRDGPDHPERLDGVLTEAGWFIVLQNGDRILAGLSSGAGQDTLRACSGDETPAALAKLADVKDALSRVDKRG